MSASCATLAPVTSSAAFVRLASGRTFPRLARVSCYSGARRQSSKRELYTTPHSQPTYHPHSLPSSFPPPPRNTGIPDTSIAGLKPQVSDTRPPSVPEQGVAASKDTSDEVASISLPEFEAQKSQPVTPPKPSTPSSTEAKPRRKLRPRKAPITISPGAVEHLRDLLALPSPKMIRVGVQNRGCSGLGYHLEYVEQPGKFDEVVEQDGVKILVDSKALFSIIGSEMDWHDDKLSTRFIFKNPNISELAMPITSSNTNSSAEEQCGCGESFMV